MKIVLIISQTWTHAQYNPSEKLQTFTDVNPLNSTYIKTTPIVKKKKDENIVEVVTHLTGKIKDGL